MVDIGINQDQIVDKFVEKMVTYQPISFYDLKKKLVVSLLSTLDDVKISYNHTPVGNYQVVVVHDQNIVLLNMIMFTQDSDYIHHDPYFTVAVDEQGISFISNKQYYNVKIDIMSHGEVVEEIQIPNDAVRDRLSSETIEAPLERIMKAVLSILFPDEE